MSFSIESSPPLSTPGPSSAAASTAPSSPSPGPSRHDSECDEVTETAESGVPVVSFDMKKDEFDQLEYILHKSKLFSQILHERMESDKQKQAEAIAALRKQKQDEQARTRTQAQSPYTQPSSSRFSTQKMKGRKRLRVEHDDDDDDDDDDEKEESLADSNSSARKRFKSEDLEDEVPIFPQPKLITGAKMKKYQLEGLQWMVALHQNGISGILGDEMGLGKTLQTISFCAYLRESNFSKAFLIVCPLSVLHNWVAEFNKFAPSIPVCMYHGAPEERAELRRTVMVQVPEEDEEDETPPAMVGGRSKSSSKRNGKGRTTQTKLNFATASKSKSKSGSKGGGRGGGRGGPRGKKGGKQAEAEDDDEHDDDDDGVRMASGKAAMSKEERAKARKAFPVVVTTYEMIIKDRAHLSHYNWGYIVVDEGHRLKNIDCKLIREIKKYTSAGRMILTGTPLHNNLAELWSLLNFVLPDIFSDLDKFQELFNLPTMETTVGSQRTQHIISSLHLILKPFLLRRLKADVELSLPPKKEYILYAPLTQMQNDLYNSVLDGGLRAHLLGDERRKQEEEEAEKERIRKEIEEDGGKMRLRSEKKGKAGKRKTYDVDGDDDDYFEMLERGEVDGRGVIVKQTDEDEAVAELGRQHHYKTAMKQVNNMKLQNTVMQLRKVCSHPFLFDWTVDPHTQQPVVDERLVDSSGKMMVLDRLLSELFRRKHKVLLFSQFTTMLDIVEEWATNAKSWKLCRIDGSTPPLERRDQMNRFQNGGDSPDAPCLFLLSTRAGGLGINLTAADTVIFYDQDWNPQMDIQAQDRAHRIGQTKPVLIFRLISAHTIETKIMQRATEKRKLEALVIAKGKFKMPAAASGRSKPSTMAEMAAELLQLEGEKIEVIPDTAAGKRSVLSDEDLDMLLDRSPGVFMDRGREWTLLGDRDTSDKRTIREVVNRKQEAVGKPLPRTAFAVYEASNVEENDMLTSISGEDID